MDAGARFTDRVAIVTGGASGIGLATARRLVQEGGRVVLGDVAEAALALYPTDGGAHIQRYPDIPARIAELGT